MLQNYADREGQENRGRNGGGGAETFRRAAIC